MMGTVNGFGVTAVQKSGVGRLVACHSPEMVAVSTWLEGALKIKTRTSTLLPGLAVTTAALTSVELDALRFTTTVQASPSSGATVKRSLKSRG